MTNAEEGRTTERDPGEVLRARVDEEAARLKAEAKERASAATKIKGLAKQKTLDDLTKLEKGLVRVEKALTSERITGLGLAPLFEEIRDYARSAESRIRTRLGRDLRDASQAEGLSFRVVSREDPVEVRIPPLLLRLDFRRGRAELLFAREVVATAAAEADAILAARKKAVARLQKGFVPERFFDEVFAAYRGALAAVGRSLGDRLEILDFLPFLAVLKQSKRFRASPMKESFVTYGKARFAYDVLRLRRAGVLSRGGWRLNFGVATGTTATQKDRVLYLEDEEGDGEYKLTVFFTPTGER